MAANVESMFYVGRQTPWHGLGTSVEGAPNSREAIWMAGLDWNVYQSELYTNEACRVKGYYANVRDSDNAVLGIVGDRYTIVQNEEAFAFADALLGEGVTYETAGSLMGGKQIWMLAKLPEKYIIAGDEIEPYIVFSNTHDGSGAVRVAMTPIRVVCQNTLNLALRRANRSWSARHTGNMEDKLSDARETLDLSRTYMKEFGKVVDQLTQVKLPDRKILEFIDTFYPVSEDLSMIQKKNNLKMNDELKARYFDAPDLKEVGKNGYRFINAVSDLATHGKPLRQTKNYQQNLFKKTVEGNPLIDKAFQMVATAA